MVPDAVPARPQEVVLPHEGGRRDAGREGLDLEDKDALLRGQPDVFFTTPHYDGYAYVLVRLAARGPRQLGELLEDAWRLVAPKRLVAAYDESR